MSIWGKRTSLNADGHDESQYIKAELNPKTGKMEMPPIVNSHRERKGGVRYEGAAIKAVQWMPDILFDREDEREKPYNDTCVSFYGYYVQAAQALGISDIRNILFDVVEQINQLPPANTYAAILKGLALPESNILLWLICDDRNHGNIALARHLIGTIRHAIENAQKIINDLTEKRKSSSPIDSTEEKRKMATSNAHFCAQNFPISNDRIS